MNICDYCHEREGIYQFQNGKWCCEKSYQMCPVIREKLVRGNLKKSQYCNTTIMKQVAASGAFKCRFCDKPGIYYKGYINNEHIFHCCKNVRDCEGFHKYLSNLHKQRFIDNPELKKKMSKLMKKVQNRPELIEKKSESMLNLHNGDCDSCKEYQYNFYKGQKNRRTDKYDKNLEYGETYKKKKLENK